MEEERRCKVQGRIAAVEIDKEERKKNDHAIGEVKSDANKYRFCVANPDQCNSSHL